MKPALEIRLTVGSGLHAEPASPTRVRGGPVVKGYAVVFNALSEDMGGFRERFAPGAFTDSLKRQGVLALFNHERSALLGRTSSGSLAVSQDSHGLGFQLVLPKTQLGADVAELVQRGDLSKMSFGFIVPSRGDSWGSERGQMIRTVHQANLYEISIVPEPAYPQSSVGLRAELDAVLIAEQAARRRRLEVLLGS